MSSHSASRCLSPGVTLNSIAEVSADGCASDVSRKAPDHAIRAHATSNAIDIMTRSLFCTAGVSSDGFGARTRHQRRRLLHRNEYVN